MTGFLEALLGVLGAALISTFAAWRSSAEEARGWKTSYERERERADRQDRLTERAELATDIATKIAKALQELPQRPGGGI